MWLVRGHSIKKKNKKFYLTRYYGKQEEEANKRSTMEKEYHQLDTQLGTMIGKGGIVITADFNAKMEIKEENYQHNGELSQQLINKCDLQKKISSNSTTCIKNGPEF